MKISEQPAVASSDWNTLHDFCSDCRPDLQISVSTIVAESLCQFVDFGQLTDFTESCVVYDGHRHRFF